MKNCLLCATLLLLIGSIIYLLINNCYQNDVVDNYCTCSNSNGAAGRAKSCSDPIKIQQEYQEGRTEFSRQKNPQ